MYKPVKSSFLGKVPAARIHQEKLTESNIKKFHALEKRKDFVVETFIKSQTSSVKHNITVVNLECKELSDIDLQGNGLEKELLNSKIRNSFAILKPSKELPLNSKTDPRTLVSTDLNSPLPRYKRLDIKVCKQNSPIPIKEKEPEKYKRDQRRIVQRPHSQTSSSEIEKYIEAFETNEYFLRSKSEEDDNTFSSSLKGQNPGKYNRQQSRFIERPHSQTSWEEIEKHIKSFDLKNKNSHFQKSTEQNLNPSSGKKYLGKSERQKFQPLEKTHSKRPQNEIEKTSVDLDIDPHFQHPSNDLWIQNSNSGQPIREKKPGKYKRSERILAERPYSQPSKKEIEKYLKVPQKWKDSIFLESKSENSSLGNDNENLEPFKKEIKYRRKSRFQERPSSQILGSKIQEFVEIFESKSKCSHRSNFEKLKFGTQEEDLNNSEPEMNSMEYERHQPSFIDKSCSKISRTDSQKSESFEHDDQSFSHGIEKFTNQSLQEPSENVIEKNKIKYSRNHRQNNRSRSAPTVFMQTNVPNYSEYSSVENSSYSFIKNNEKITKEVEENEEALSVELKHHDTLRKAIKGSLLTGQRLKSPDITALQLEQRHVKNGYLDRRNVRKSDISDFLSLQSIFNRRPNKKTGEDIQNYSTIKENTDLEPERYLPISPQYQKERPISNLPPERLHEDSNFENIQINLDIPEETGGKCPINCNKPDSISKTDEFQQNNLKTNHLLLDSVQTNAPLYYQKLSHEEEKLVTKRKEFKESSMIIENFNSNMSNNTSTDSLSFSLASENEISVKSKNNSMQNGNDRHSGHFMKEILPEANNPEKTKNNSVQNGNDRHSGHFMKEILPEANNPSKSKNNSVQNGNDRHSGHFMKEILPEANNPEKTKNNSMQNRNDRHSRHFMKEILPEANNPEKTKNNSVQNGNDRHSGHFMKEILPEANNPSKSKNNSIQNGNDRHSGHFMKEILPEADNSAKTKNNSMQNGNDRHSGHFMNKILPEANNPEETRTNIVQNNNDRHSGHFIKEILPKADNPIKTKSNFVQNENNRSHGHFTKDILPESDKQTPQSKETNFFNTLNHFSEKNINSLELDYPSHPLDKGSFQKDLETKENNSVADNSKNLNLSIDKKLSPIRVRNGQNQSSENEMGPAKLDWSISEISIVENEMEAEELSIRHVDGSNLLTPVENDVYHFASHDLEVSKKMFSNSFIELKEELKRSYSSSQISRNSVKKNKKLEFPSTKDEIESVKCQFMLQKHFSLWKKEWHMHLAAKILWKRHSLQKGINALRQFVQNSQLVSGVLQERIKKVWLKSCFQKWKQEMSIKQRDQLAAAFQEWKENAEEQKRFRILKQIQHKNMLLLCFQKWRSHYKSKIMFLRALMHNRMSLLYSMWHHWVIFVKQNQQKKFWQVMARKYQRKKLQSRTLKGLMSVYRNLVKAKSHYRLQKMKMALQFWRRGAAISSHQSEQIVVAVQQCSNELVLRRTLDIWVNQLWLICESRRADRWILSRYMSVWHRKWCCMISWRQKVVAKIEHQQTHTIIYKWHQNVQLQKQRHKLATKHIQRVLLIQLLTKWTRFAKRQVKSRLHLQTQVTSGQYRLKLQILLTWKNKLLEKLKTRQIYYLWSEQCVRKAINRWKVSHHQATLDKRVLLFQPLRNVLVQKDIFRKWKCAWGKANKEKEDVHRSHTILQLKLLGAIFHKWHSQTLGTLAAKPFIQHRQSQLLLCIFRAWHHFLWEKHQRRKKSLQLQNYHLKQLFYKWRNLFILREKEKNLKIYHSRKLLCKCVQGWQIIIQRKTRALHFHQRMLFQKFFFWKEKTTHSLRCKAMKVAEQHCCRTVQQHFFSRWRQNAIQQKIHRTESMQHIEKIQKENILTQALTSWKHLLRIRILARNHYNHRLVILMRQALLKWHWFTEYTSCFAVRCLQRQLHIDTWIECPHNPKHHGWHWQEEELLQDELNKGNGSIIEESHQAIGADEDTCETTGHRNQKVMTRQILQLKYWPMSLAFVQWRHYTQMCHQLKTVTQQLHMKHITVVLSTTFCLWRQQQRAAKLARRHQEHKLMKRSFREIQKYAVCRRSKKALLTKARNHHSVAVFKTYFPIWQKKVKEKQYWDKVAKLLNHSSPEEQLLQPMEFQLTSLLGQRSLQTYFHIWQETYQQARFYRQQYHQRLLIRYLHIWRSWATYRQHLGQKCNVFRKKRIQSLALQVWTCRVHQNKWIKKTQGQKVNTLSLIILRQWHQWSSKSNKQKAAEAKVRQNHVILILSQVFNSITREFHKINKACQWYQNQLTKKVIVAWSHRSQYQIQERDKIKKFQQQKNKAMIQRILQIWKHTYLVRCEAKYNREQRIHLKVCCIAAHWKKRAKKTRGKILEAVFTDRMVRFCFSVWRNRFEMMKQLEGQLHLFTSWKQQETQRHLFIQWKSTLLVTRADQAFKNKLLSIVLKGWQNWTKASLLYQRRLQEYKNILRKRYLESTFRIWKIGWKYKQTSTKLFKQNIQSRALKAWYYYVQDQVRLKILQAYMAKQLRARHLLSAYCKWKGMVTARLNERKKEKQQAVIAEKHYKTHLSMVSFQAWLQETLISRCIVRHQMRLVYKYYHRWKYYTDLSYTAALWSEKLSYKQVWCKWRAAFIREKTAATMETEFCQQNMRQIFRIWYQYCRYKKIHEKESLFPGICLNLANI